MTHQLEKLPYAFDALEPYLDAKTMEIHHDKHHAGYVTNLNNALKDQPKWADLAVIELVRKIDQVPETIRTAVRNNGGGHANHTFFWEIMGPRCGGEPKGPVAEVIKKTFGEFKAFKEKFNMTATTRFGSGWAWLALTTSKTLEIYSTPNQDNPWMEGKTPILGLDVWEHAYYLKYQNRRPEYIEAWWNTVNWARVNELYERCIGS